MISLNHDASEVQVECNRIYSNCRGAAFTRCRTCFRRQRYGEFQLFPNNRAKSSPTCCDGVGEMRQTASKPQNPVASKIKFGGYRTIYRQDDEVSMSTINGNKASHTNIFFAIYFAESKYLLIFASKIRIFVHREIYIDSCFQFFQPTERCVIIQ